MSRCVACDFCDTVGEMSPYKWGLTTPDYSGKFVIDNATGDEYCMSCYVSMYDLFTDKMIEENEYGSGPLSELGGDEVEFVDSGDAGRDAEANNED